jgi:hypothetical protein
MTRRPERGLLSALATTRAAHRGVANAKKKPMYHRASKLLDSRYGKAARRVEPKSALLPNPKATAAKSAAAAANVHAMRRDTWRPGAAFDEETASSVQTLCRDVCEHDCDKEV